MSLPLIIVNPHSAAGSTRENWAGTAADLRAHFGPFKAAFTRGPGDGRRLAREAALQGRPLIIACGGDGTINEVANGIIESGADAEMAVLPSGTGGDFRRTIGLANAPREAARALRNGMTKHIDVGKVSFTASDGSPAERYFLNVSSFGLAVSIIERVKSTKALDWLPVTSVRGRANFALSTFREVVGLESLTVRIGIDEEKETTLQTINFCVANARYFGGGMMIAPDAKLDDGLLDVVNIGDIKTARVILNAYTLYTGSHLRLEEVGSRLAKRITAAPADPTQMIHIETDGELPGRLPAVFESIPAALKMRIPTQPF